MQVRMLKRVAVQVAAVALVAGASLLANPFAGPVNAAGPSGSSVRDTTVRSDDGKTLPAKVYRAADGSTETVVDKAEFKKLVDRAARLQPAGCGSACDGKDPATYWVPLPRNDYYLCADDAITVYSKSGYANVELRYSPQCRTAWARGCCYTNFAGFGYYSNGSYRNVVYAYGRNNGSTIYSAMLNDAGLLFKACFDNQIGGSPEWQCTGLW